MHGGLGRILAHETNSWLYHAWVGQASLLACRRLLRMKLRLLRLLRLAAEMWLD